MLLSHHRRECCKWYDKIVGIGLEQVECGWYDKVVGIGLEQVDVDDDRVERVES